MTGVLMLSLLALCIVLFTGGIFGKDDYSSYNNFYKELGCVKKEKSAGFECLEYPSKNGSCRFQDHFIPSGSNIDQNLLKGSCIPEAKCGNDGMFIFPGTDCGLLSQEGCHLRHSLDSCCPGDLICGDNIAKCDIEGKTYKEGEKVYLKESCDVCVCDNGFKKEAPFCRPVNCYLEVLRQHELADHDAPVYMKGETCCPSTWIKDEGEDQIFTVVEDVEDIACKFGKREVHLGQGFHRNYSRFGTEAKLRCECTNPPFVICHEE